jgi:hypothetical protein
MSLMSIASLPLTVKVKLTLSLIRFHTMETYGGMEVYLHRYLTSRTKGVERLASLPVRFTPLKDSAVAIG